MAMNEVHCRQCGNEVEREDHDDKISDSWKCPNHGEISERETATFEETQIDLDPTVAEYIEATDEDADRLVNALVDAYRETGSLEEAVNRVEGFR